MSPIFRSSRWLSSDFLPPPQSVHPKRLLSRRDSRALERPRVSNSCPTSEKPHALLCRSCYVFVYKALSRPSLSLPSCQRARWITDTDNTSQRTRLAIGRMEWRAGASLPPARDWHRQCELPSLGGAFIHATLPLPVLTRRSHASLSPARSPGQCVHKTARTKFCSGAGFRRGRFSAGVGFSPARPPPPPLPRVELAIDV